MGSAMNEFEKRKMDRFDLELPAWLYMTDEGGKQKTLEAMTTNICAGGAFFKTNKSISTGTDVQMGMVLHLDRLNKYGATTSRISVSGSVIRTEEQGIAVRFDDNYNISPYVM